MILNLNKGCDLIMILTYIGDENLFFKKSYDYFSFEIYIDLREGLERLLYRVINSYGEIAIFEGENFEIKQGTLGNVVYIKNKFCDKYTIRLKSLQELDDASNDVNGVWGAYHNGHKETEDKVHEIIKKQAKQEGFYIEKLVST